MHKRLKWGLLIGKLFLPKNTIVEVITPEESGFDHFRKLEINKSSKYVLIRYNDKEVIVDKWELK
jgi:hypothetical protein